MGFLLLVIAVNIGPFLLAGVPWFFRRWPSILLATGFALIPLIWLWVQYGHTYYHLIPDQPWIEPRIILPGFFVVALGLSAAIRAYLLQLGPLAILFLAVSGIALVGTVALPSKIKRLNWERSVIKLAEDRRLRLGDQTIILPRVALLGVRDLSGESIRSRLEDFSPDQTIDVSAVVVSFYSYAGYGETSYSAVICAELSRSWARRVCDSDRTGLFEFLPIRVAFTRDSMVDRLWPGEAGDRRRKVAHRALAEEWTEMPEVECAPEPTGNRTRICEAAALVAQGSAAVWTISHRDREKIQKQMTAIRTLFLEGMGETENKFVLEAAFQ